MLALMQNSLTVPVVRQPPPGPAGRMRPIGQSVIPIPANDDAARKLVWVDDRLAHRRSAGDRAARETLDQRVRGRAATALASESNRLDIDAVAFDIGRRQEAYARPIAPFLAQHIAQERVGTAAGGANAYANASAAYRETFNRDRTILGPQVDVSYRL